MTVAGPTCCGKTTWLNNVLKHGLITPTPHKIIWCYREWQQLYSEMLQQMANITFVQGIELPEVDEHFPHLIVLDDLMLDATTNKDVSNMFTVGSHHKNISVICLLQNIFYQGKENRTMSLNSHYLVLFKNPRDQLQVSCLARQMYPHKSAYFLEKFLKATSQPYGCLVVDLKQDTLEKDRLKPGNTFASLHGEGVEKTVKKLQTRPPGIPAYPDREEKLEGSGNKSTSRKERVHFGYTNQSPIKVEPMGERDHLPSSRQSVNTMPSCQNCGICFETPYFLKMHQHIGCILPNEDEIEMEEEKSNPWATLLQQTFDKYNKAYSDRIDQLVEEGISEKTATQKSFRQLMPEYKNTLIQLYKSFLEQMNAVSKSWRHKEIMQVLEWYMGWKGYTFEKALEITLRKKRRLFEEIIEEEDDDEDAEAIQQDVDEDDIPLSELAGKKK